MTLYGDGTRGEVERPSSERFGADPALTTDLIKSMAVSSAELWHDVLQRLTELQASQVLLAQAIAEIGAVVHESLGSGSRSEIGSAPSTPELAAGSSVASVASDATPEAPAASVESEAVWPLTDVEPTSPSEDASLEWTPPVFEPAGRRPKHRRGQSESNEELEATSARASRAERRMAAQESKAAAKLEKVMANDAKVAAKEAKATAKASAKAAGKGEAVTLGSEADKADDAPTADEASTSDKKASMFKREISFGRKRRPSKAESVVAEPAEAHVDLLDSMQSFVVEDPGVFVDTAQAVQLPPPPPVVTPPPPVVTPPPPIAYRPPPVAVVETVMSVPEQLLADPVLADTSTAAPMAPQPLVYTPNRPTNQFDVSALDHSPLATPPAEMPAVPEPVAFFEPAAVVDTESEPVLVGAPLVPANESSVTLASEILANAPARNESSATQSEPRPLVISEDLTLMSKSRKRKMQFRIR